MSSQQYNRKISTDKLYEFLRNSLAEALYLEVSEIDINKPFVDLGLDSIVGVEWMKTINKEFGLEISATKVYDYASIKALALFLAKELENSQTSITEDIQLEPSLTKPVESPVPKGIMRPSGSFPTLKRKLRNTKLDKEVKSEPGEKIAIIGMSGRYPQAANLKHYWNNLAQGKNSITEIPNSRWSIDTYYDPDPSKMDKMYCKWLGMLDDVDCFDPLFFQIPPADAETMDPQHRIFLEESYKAFEDAGYSNARLGNTKCGVYMGIMSNDYNYHLSKSTTSNINITGNSFAIGAARIAYFLNLKGPAIPIDTACSSSLVAIHLACQGLKNREIDMALAGGVSLYLNPQGYIGMCQAGMLSPDGQCKTFDNAADGFVPGEGVGALVLKRLEDAERDNDFIHGVIVGSAINQDGKTNGITAPSAKSQIELERDLYKRYNINPQTITYVEAHGTGTKLGDPIELEALSTVFKEGTSEKNFCAIGSVKSNIGHTSGAAGVASVQKAILSIKHKTIVPTLNVTKENTIFDFKNSPFYIAKEKQAWEPGEGNTLRRAAVSSFGFSGTNAHLVIEEYSNSEKQAVVAKQPDNPEIIIPLSARTQDQLRQKISELFDFISIEKEKINLRDMAYTLQTGRDQMRNRVGFVVASLAELQDKLHAYLQGSPNLEGVRIGQVSRDAADDTDTQLTRRLKRCIADKQWVELLDLWVKGVAVDWSTLYKDTKPQRISLPSYPFAKERYWVQVSDEAYAKINDKVHDKSKGRVAELPKKITYRPLWKQSDLPSQVESAEGFSPNGPVMVIDPNEELSLALQEQLKQDSSIRPFIRVKHAAQYHQINQMDFAINLRDQTHWQRLLESLKSADKFPKMIIHSGSKYTPPTGDDLSNHQFNEHFLTFFSLSKAIISLKHSGGLRLLSLSSKQGESFSAPDEAIGSFFKTLALENPKYQGKVVQVEQNDLGTAPTVAEIAEIALKELTDKEFFPEEIYYKVKNDNQYSRYIKVLTPIDSVENKIEKLPFKQNGVYIISGGLGGLGLIFSEYLVKNYSCKLVLFGRSELNEQQEDKLKQLRSYQSELLYLRADVSKWTDVQELVKITKEKFGQISGVLHSAGVQQDSYILNKSITEAEAVLKPKINGTIHLDLATKDEPLDLFLLFSSIASVLGNQGQSDYAYGNGFMDSFSHHREGLVSKNQRYGLTLSVNWPYWEAGGMALSAQEIALSKERTGLHPLPEVIGLAYLEELISLKIPQAVALYGPPSKVKDYVNRLSVGSSDSSTAIAHHTLPQEQLLDKTVLYLKNLIGKQIKLDPERMDPQEKLDGYGIDSIIISRINSALEKDLGALSKTLLYEYPTIEELALYLSTEYKQTLSSFFNLKTHTAQNSTAERQKAGSSQGHKSNSLDTTEASDPIAIIGVHGYYPQSKDLNAYWENLKRGKDMIDLVPKERWDYEQYYHQDPEQSEVGKIYCKWGGFVDQADKFDPKFFNISSKEAIAMDPQERLFLESVWASLEDAGYTRETLKRKYPKSKSANVGVFVGTTTNTYNLHGATSWSSGNATPSAHPWSIANRISYFFDFQGPSMPIDTACSSSSVAIHMACESLKKQECQVAVAGGVNLYLHPSKYHSLCKKRMVSLSGKCYSYGAGDDGFVPGEAVGSIILKPLSKALEDRDHIYAVVKGSAFDHSGKSNGYAAPNPNAQAELISHTLEKAGVSPQSVSYVEGHGTGTQLGDSMEIVALTNAFNRQTAEKQFCAVGSVKANIGHPESAAGIAGVAKVLLQMKHKQLVPSINSNQVNPNIVFKDTPFFLQEKLMPWKSSSHPRRALINSFGAGGVNACLLLEEFNNFEANQAEAKGPYVVVLSAKNKENLRGYVNKFLAYIGKSKNLNLEAMSYTLQIGREAMAERLAMVFSNPQELVQQLKEWREGKLIQGVVQGTADTRGRKGHDAEQIQQAIEKLDLNALAQMWVNGAQVNWEALYPNMKPSRMPLPTAVFSKQSYWFSDHNTGADQGKKVVKDSKLHPLVCFNSSTLKGISFSSELSENEFYASDHQVNKEPIFPGAGFLEIAAITANIAAEQRVRKINDIVWVNPLSFREGTQRIQTFLYPKGERTAFKIVSFDYDNNEVIHCEGGLEFSINNNNLDDFNEKLSLTKLKDQCQTHRDSTHFYGKFKEAGFNYGSTFQTVQEFYLSPTSALSKLELSPQLKDEFDQYIIHPSLMDGALQTVAALVSDTKSKTPYLPFAIDEIELIRPLSQACYAYVQAVDSNALQKDTIKKFNIQILNQEGLELVRINNFYARAHTPVQQLVTINE